MKEFKLSSKWTYGPVQSRRYGVSWGINVLPPDKKVCSFNCPYCQCGWGYKKDIENVKYPSVDEIVEEVKFRLVSEPKIDCLTFAGNGEPTMHPEFLQLVKAVIDLKTQYHPDAYTTVLSDGAHIKEQGVADALDLIDYPMIKLDVGTEKMFKLLNIPLVDITLNDIVTSIKLLPRRMIQSMFVTGRLDNTVEEEVSSWIENLVEIQPSLVQIYSIERFPADNRLCAVSSDILEGIARRVKNNGIEVEVF